jgi:HAD superfamily hydrolase (TIGR01490 family)
LALAIFDIDGTLITGPSLEKRLFTLLFRQGRLGPTQLLAFARFGIGFAPEFGRHTMKKNKAYLSGLGCADVDALVSAWVRRAAPGWWYPPALARLRQHQATGDTVVLLSGTPQFVADALARELGLTRAIGTCCMAEAGRFCADPPLVHPFGAEKRALAEVLCAESGTPVAAMYSYGDSVHDLPLLRLAGHPVAVRPDAALLAAAKAAGWEILGSR